MARYGIRMMEAETRITPLHLAAMLGDLELIREHSSTLGAKDMRLGWTALHWAGRGDNLEASKLLLDLGVDSSVQDKRGMTTLHISAGRGNQDIVKALVLKDGRVAFMKDAH
ncbi:hypothetical protein AbraCBS73388_007055, partial [Aspergillus brasiliensis]